MNKTKQKLNVLIFSIVIALSITITPLAVVKHQFFNGLTVSEAEYPSRLSVKFYTKKGIHTPFASINTVKSGGLLYVTLPRLLADGSYGGGAGDVKRVAKLTEGLLYKHELEEGYHKMKLTATDGLNIILNFVQIEVQT